MRERNGHHLLYRGPAKGIPTITWRTRLADILSAYGEQIVLTLCFITVLLDVFLWRP